ncbi:hypothetical protein HaLaN_21056, partial [Haematococcus lacustris]
MSAKPQPAPLASPSQARQRRWVLGEGRGPLLLDPSHTWCLCWEEHPARCHQGCSQVGGNLGPWLEDADRTTAPSGPLPLAAGQQQPAATSLSFAPAAAAPGAAASGPELQDSADLLGLVDSGSMLELQRQ